MRAAGAGRTLRRPAPRRRCTAASTSAPATSTCCRPAATRVRGRRRPIRGPMLGSCCVPPAWLRVRCTGDHAVPVVSIVPPTRAARAGCSKTASYGHWGSNPRMFCYEHRCAPAATRPHDGERPAAVGRACRARTGPARSPCYLRGYSAPHARRGCRPGSAGAPTGPQHGAPAGRSQAAPPSGQRARAGRRTWSARPCRPRRGVSRAARARRAAQSARPRVRARLASAPACRAAGWGSLHAQAPAVVESDAAGRSRSLRMCRQLSSARGMRGVSPSELCALLAACWELLLLGACAWRPTSPRQGRC